MHSTPTMQQTDRRSAVLIDPEVVLAARADRAASPAAKPASAPAPMVDPAFRPDDLDMVGPVGGRSSIATWAIRTSLAVAFAVCSAVAAAAWQTYGDQAQEMVGRWMPHLSLLIPVEKDASAAPATAAVQPAASDPAASEDHGGSSTAIAPAQSVDAAATGAEPAATSQDSAQLLQSMAHDIAAMGQQIADLKASVAQLKASQEQMAQQIARAPEPKPAERTAEAKPFDPKAIEQTLRPRHAPRPATTPAVVAAPPVHRPRPVYPAAQTIATPSAPPAAMPLPSALPPQASADPGVETVVRPPMPVR